jgi:hypothetical protein
MFNSSALYGYDIVVGDCTCSASDRGPSGYGNMKTYLDHGGRFFGSHWEYDWFGDSSAPADWQSAVTWYPSDQTFWFSPQYKSFIDTTFPKGKALDEWTQFVYGSHDIVGASSPPPDGTDPVTAAAYVLSANVQPGVTRWIYSDPDNTTMPASATQYQAHYLSIDMPYSATPASTTQCGRAFFGDTHIVGEASQASALEFVFFDLNSCVQDETAPPMVPPSVQ